MGVLAVLAYPLVVAAISLLFARGVWSQYRRRQRPHQRVWSFALLLSAAASLAYVASVSLGGSAFFFRLYYLFGAAWMAAWLGLGSVFLAAPPRWARGIMWAVALASALTAWLLLAAPLDPVALRNLGGGPGTGVLRVEGAGLAAVILIAALNTFGLTAVAGVALWSAWRWRRRTAPASFFWGNLLIGLGAVINGLAGTMARLGAGRGFWATMAVGWAVIYGGFLLLSPASERRIQAQGQ